MLLCKLLWYIEATNWEDKGDINIFTFEKLEKTINQFEKQHHGNKASILQIHLSSGTYLEVGLGYPKIWLFYVSPNECKTSLGDKENRDIVEFWWGNESEEFRKRELIPNALARHAILYFVKSGGKLTEEVTWYDGLLESDIDEIPEDIPF
ncbi:hypothetical protein PN36_12125 [Candidatus Thiomargarita nelsonii]|uniref:Uncharacterized protein n=1 Tax=Candidatus Thiomargarita nelsonii TaxID=1003181 RepID=A0A4E0QR13_9GAMM|nr:hypothetical protein PN36_12125 [Candidatus Thiomargarita nelsonii]